MAAVFRKGVELTGRVCTQGFTMCHMPLPFVFLQGFKISQNEAEAISSSVLSSRDYPGVRTFKWNE